jgi:hypothetical protein
MGTRLRKTISRMRPFKNPQLSQVSMDPSAITNITEAGGITITNKIMRVQGSGGAITLTATPGIATSFTVDGFELILEGQSDTNTLTLQEESNLTNSGFKLNDKMNVTLGKGDILRLMYNATDAKWYQSAPFADN